VRIVEQRVAPDAGRTDPPRRLRLPALLLELGAREHPAEDTAERASQSIQVGEIVDKAQEAGFGFLLAVLALIAIPFVGLSTPFGLAVALCGAQMLVGRSRPWLPRRARRRALKMTMLDRVVQMLARRMRWLTKITRRRWEALLVGPMWSLVGLGVVLQGLGLALPLPIPGSNLIFIVPILLYAVGLLERDGVLLAVAHLWTAINLALLVVFGATVVEVLRRAAHWIGL
jgi:hypothetical protein